MGVGADVGTWFPYWAAKNRLLQGEGGASKKIGCHTKGTPSSLPQNTFLGQISLASGREKGKSPRRSIGPRRGKEGGGGELPKLRSTAPESRRKDGSEGGMGRTGEKGGQGGRNGNRRAKIIFQGLRTGKGHCQRQGQCWGGWVSRRNIETGPVF